MRESETDEYERLREHSTETDEYEKAQHTEHRDSIESIMVVSEGFESERIKEKNRFEIRSFSKVQNSVVWTFTVCLFIFYFFK